MTAIVLFPTIRKLRNVFYKWVLAKLNEEMQYGGYVNKENLETDQLAKYHNEWAVISSLFKRQALAFIKEGYIPYVYQFHINLLIW